MRKWFLAAVWTVAALGCAGPKGEQRADETATEQQALSPQAWCPMAVEGTTVRAEETSDGAALAFTTTGDVGELRKRLAAMAEKHGKMREGGGTCPCPCGMGPDAHGGMQGGGMGPHGGMTPEMHAGMMAMRQARVRMEETEGGGRLLFTPADPAQLPALRQAVQSRAAMMAAGGCPMMQKDRQPPAPPADSAG